jgi:hypothetical protein
MSWDVEVSDEFVAWFHALTGSQRIKIAASVELLETLGPQLGFPHSSQVKGSRFGAMRELRIQIGGEPWRVLYAFDPRRTAYLILGGCKQGNDLFYDQLVPKADSIFEQHLREI